MPLAGLVITSLLLMALAVPMILNKIPKNYLYGFRTHRTISGTNEEWYRANHHANISLFVAGLISLLVCLLVPHLSARAPMARLVCTGVLLVSVLAAVGYAFARQDK